MAKLIKQIHDLVDIAFNKGLTDYWSRPQVDAAVYSAVNELFRVCAKEYPKTLLSRSYMLALQRTATITLTTGIGSLPADFHHEVEFFVTATRKRIPIKERGFWDTAKNDPVDVPTVNSPIGTIYADSSGVKKLELYPTTAANPGVLYFKTPVMPVYATTIVTGNLVYDDASSVDVEFPVTLHDLIVEKALAPLGLGVQNGQAVRMSFASQGKDAKIG